ncbi:conjugative transposon protein TraM [Sinomicrobium soli]|uniref:conjugative transposon protein TraM n=1 Tax=Sinomicrobium sp. N-1-3-6 TaxID=2219864 RepID=UPI000DCDE63A|nr:conjugative transposon protein TraM [Sinomicrobium sp. N-1-3-6]RAV29228.1 conjugal transfer protein TraM [Sinomicrobium sp. N-1-3-6]
MKLQIDKKKLLFGGVIGTILLFIIGYAVFFMGGKQEASENMEQTSVPKLNASQEEYRDRLEAVDELKDKKKSDAPSIYDERLLDSSGVYDPDLEEKKKQRMVDSIYRQGRIDYQARGYRNSNQTTAVDSTTRVNAQDKTDPGDIQKGQEGFFKVGKALWDAATPKSYTQPVIRAVIHNTQTVKVNSRLELRLTEDAIIRDVSVPKNTLVYGFVKLKANRAMITITNINHQAVNLKAYDLQDGNEGIYIENSFREEITTQITDDVIQGVNIAGVPQVRGLKNVFRRDNRKIRNTIYNHYALILKADNEQ